MLPADLVRLLEEEPRRWLVTGAAGFIGSHLVEHLLRHGQEVAGLDNFATGRRANLDEVRDLVGPAAWRRFTFHEADIRDPEALGPACAGAEIVLHQAALGSVPRSIENPAATHAANVTGTLHVLDAARRAGAARVVLASSSSVYGDEPNLPKHEDRIGRPLSPYASSKRMLELYAWNYATNFGLATVCLRYFNVFGPRQDPEGAYAAVIPRWAAALARSEAVTINGDGSTSRDFCFVLNVVQANLRAALWSAHDPARSIFNIAVGDRTTLLDLHARLAAAVAACSGRDPAALPAPRHGPFRAGDVAHSLADIGRARDLLGYAPTHDLAAGLAEAVPWYLRPTGSS